MWQSPSVLPSRGNIVGRVGLSTGATAVEQSQASGRAEQRVRALQERLLIMVEDVRLLGVYIMLDHLAAQAARGYCNRNNKGTVHKRTNHTKQGKRVWKSRWMIGCQVLHLRRRSAGGNPSHWRGGSRGSSFTSPQQKLPAEQGAAYTRHECSDYHIVRRTERGRQ